MTGDAVWRRFTTWTAVLAGMSLAFGLTLSYGSAYKAAFNAGFDRAWLDAGAIQVRPAHVFPLTLDVPLLVGYAGSIALAGKRSRAWAMFVLVACSVATIGLQIADGAGLVTDHVWIRALIHGWPPAMAVLTAHLFVVILQALGLLVPPVAEPARPSWMARVWAWVQRARADIKAAEKLATPDPQTGGHVAPAEVDTGQDTLLDTGQDVSTPEGATQDRTPLPAGVVDMSTRTPSETAVLERVRAGKITQAKAAEMLGVKSTKTIQRRVAKLEEAEKARAAR